VTLTNDVQSRVNLTLRTVGQAADKQTMLRITARFVFLNAEGLASNGWSSLTKVIFEPTALKNPVDIINVAAEAV
jgi:hypothetical protein